MPKVLIIEDDFHLANLYKMGLEKAKYEVSVCDDSSAIATVGSIKPDLVVLDLLMPKIKGLDILKAIRGDDQIKNTPVLILTNVEGTGEMEEAVNLGVSGYLLKSEIRIDGLVERVSEILAGDAKSDTI